MQQRKPMLVNRFWLLLAICGMILAVLFWLRRSRPERLMELPVENPILAIRNGMLYWQETKVTGFSPAYERRPGKRGIFPVVPQPLQASWILHRVPLNGSSDHAQRRFVFQGNGSYLTETPKAIYYLQSSGTPAGRRLPNLAPTGPAPNPSTTSSAVGSGTLQNRPLPVTLEQVMFVPLNGGIPHTLSSIRRHEPMFNAVPVPPICAGNTIYWTDAQPTHYLFGGRNGKRVVIRNIEPFRLMAMSLRDGSPREVMLGSDLSIGPFVSDDSIYYYANSRPDGTGASGWYCVSYTNLKPRLVLRAEDGISEVTEWGGRFFYVKSVLEPASKGSHSQASAPPLLHMDIMQANADGRGGRMLYRFKVSGTDIADMKAYRGKLYFVLERSLPEQANQKESLLCYIPLNRQPVMKILYTLPAEFLGNTAIDGSYWYFTTREERETSKEISWSEVLYRYRLPD